MLKYHARPNVIIALIAGAAILTAGSVILLTHASGFFAATEAENGTKTANAVTITDASASGGSAVKFTSGASPVTTLHYTANIGSDQATAASLGFNLFDMAGSTSNPADLNNRINALPSGVKVLVWVGNLDNAPASPCPAPGFTYSQFTAQVDALKNNPRVFGYYLSDEPHPSICPNAASDIQARADYIRSNAPGQVSFIVVLDGTNMCGGSLGCEYAALNPSHTHVDYIGLDPYPCHYAGDGVTAVACDNTQITDRFNSAVANGVPASAIIPTFQTFGQAGRTDGKQVYYRMPSASELTSMINIWNGLLPHPAFDYAYEFGIQCSSSCPAPQGIINHPEIQAVVSDHNK
jgi:hypothetical protein